MPKFVDKFVSGTYLAITGQVIYSRLSFGLYLQRVWIHMPMWKVGCVCDVAAIFVQSYTSNMCTVLLVECLMSVPSYVAYMCIHPHICMSGIWHICQIITLAITLIKLCYVDGDFS